LIFNNKAKNILLTDISGDTHRVIKYNRLNFKGDSLMFWLPKEGLEEVKIRVQDQAYIDDTIKVRMIEEKAKKVPQPKVTVSSANDLYGSGRIRIIVSEPVIQQDTAKIKWIKDSIAIAPLARFDDEDSSHTFFGFNKELPYNQKITIIFNKGAFTTIYGRQNDSFAMEIKKLNEESLGVINIQVVMKSKGKIVLAELTDSRNQIIRSNTFNKDTVLVYKDLLPATYRLRCIRDDNGNGQWDPGSYVEKRQPEKTMYSQPIILKANWELGDLKIIVP
jgi:hypothetical protein